MGRKKFRAMEEGRGKMRTTIADSGEKKTDRWEYVNNKKIVFF